MIITCWASRTSSLAGSGRCAHRVEEWSNFESPALKDQNKWVSSPQINSTQVLRWINKRDVASQQWPSPAEPFSCAGPAHPSAPPGSIRMYSWLVGCTVPRAKGPPTCSFSKALSRKSVKFMAVQHWSSRENRCDRHLTTKVYSSNLNTCTMLYSRIQKLSVEDTANILQGLSRSGYMLKKSWTQQSTC